MSPSLRALILVTRPGGPGERLTERMRARGFDALWWPAFDIGEPDDYGPARRALGSLAEYDLALFVSPNAVQAVAGLLPHPWPAATAIGAVGTATRAAVLGALPDAKRAALISPDDEGGSEAFWQAWQSSGRRAQRVLLLRAAHGREWIAEQFAAAGATVDTVAVYARRPHRPGPSVLAHVQRSVAAAVAPVIVFSSSEAVAAVDEQLELVSGAKAWLRSGIALATHPRVAELARSAGYARVERCASNDDAVIVQLESLAR